MKSTHCNKFNHDPQAAGYDSEVKDSVSPIRAGYQDTLKWVAYMTNQQKGSVLELGMGTGNLTSLLENHSHIKGLDISEKMLAKAKTKIKSSNVEFETADILEYCLNTSDKFDTIVSTYALHHLTPQEKNSLLDKLDLLLTENGCFITGDLMFESNHSKIMLLEEYRQKGHLDLVKDILDEFFWDIEETKRHLQNKPFHFDYVSFSELSWGICIRKI